MASAKGDGLRIDASTHSPSSHLNTSANLPIQASTNVWVDHCEFYSDMDHDKDYYDGLLDASHGSDFITVSNNYFHDHQKTSLIGHSDKNAAEDTGHLRITFANNHWKSLGSRGPSLRFGTGHIYNNFYEDMVTAVDSRDGAQVLLQSNAFKNVQAPSASLYSDDLGFITEEDNDYGGASNQAPAGHIKAGDIPYDFTLLGSHNVAATVPGNAGATLTF